MDKELEVAVELASTAAQTLMKSYWGKTISWRKPDTTKITNADVDTERFLVDELEKHFPTHSILTEESQEMPESRRQRLSNAHVWIIDPVDGTDDLDAMTTDFAINMAYLRDGQPYAAVVCLPAHGKIYMARRGEGAYMHYAGGFNKIAVSHRSLEESIITISKKSYPPEKATQLRDKTGAKGHILQGCRGVRICAVAEGIADFTFIRDVKAGEWDACAPGLILEEAYGKTTDYEGKAHTYNKENPILTTGAIFSNGVFHDKLLPLMREFAPLK